MPFGVSALFLLLITISQSQDSHFAKLDVSDDFIQIRGVWLPDNLNPKNEPVPSVDDVACYRHGGMILVRSDAYCIDATAQIIDGEPNIDVRYFPVLSWDKSRIIAADSSTDIIPVCLWSQITVNLNEKTVALTDIRKLGKGHEGLNNFCLTLPLTENYHLVDELFDRLRRTRKK